MSAATRIGLALMLLVAAPLALTAPDYVNVEDQLTPAQRHDTGLDTLTRQQLELLNHLLREKAALDAAALPAPTRDAAAATEDTAAAQRGDEQPRAIPMDLDIRTIRSRLRGPVDGWEPGTEFRLENGQAWKVLKGAMKLRQTLESPEILVVPGLAGRWFLQVHEDYPKARVYRID
ncbi:hypothetical protein [Tahibacter sp.]|uniref:hypothetical protein n=1 Tax=Tahibacter sp. TaxID=2056211 RepID=UPI0028C427D8|nr:hypothetical protein [Tahibacter sp.]